MDLAGQRVVVTGGAVGGGSVAPVVDPLPPPQDTNASAAVTMQIHCTPLLIQEIRRMTVSHKGC